MDKYGLTEQEKQTHVQSYNHALFRNMAFFLDVVCEINILMRTVVVLEDKGRPERNNKEYPFEEFAEYVKAFVTDGEMEIFSKYFRFDYITGLTGEVSFDLHVRRSEGEAELHNLVFTPAFDENHVLYCVYLGARNIQAEVRREMEEYRRQKQFLDLLMQKSYFYFSFDVTGEGLITEEAVSKDGGRLISEIAKQPMPVLFEDFVAEWFASYAPVFNKSEDKQIFTREYLRRAYQNKESLITLEMEQNCGDPSGMSSLVQIFIVLMEQPENKHIYATVIWNDLSGFQKKAIEDNRRLRSSNESLQKTLSKEQQYRREEQRQRETLQEAYEAAHAANTVKTDFLTRMSHDIRRPMNAIVGMASMATRHLDNSDRMLECLREISDSGKYLLSMLSEVMDMSKIEAGKLELSHEEFDLSRVLEDIFTICRFQCEEKKHMFSITELKIGHKRLIGDAKRLQQALMNLTDNAIKYTPDGGSIHFAVVEKPSDREGTVCYEFTVDDSGIGMGPDYLKQLFEPFVRAEDRRVAKIQGIGLGLPISKNIFQMMDGNIEVKSKLNMGTTITVHVYLGLPGQDGTTKG